MSVRAAFTLKKANIRLLGAESPIAMATATELSLGVLMRPTSTVVIFNLNKNS